MKVSRIIARSTLVMAAMAALIAAPALAADHSANAMMSGGCTSNQDCAAKLQHGDGTHSASSMTKLYASHGVTPAGLASPNTVMGTVTKSGEVLVPGKGVVATNAYSYGRSDISGSTKQGSLFKRKTSVSFQQDSLPALVRMQDGRFKYALILDCGNIVTATPKPVVKAVAPQPAPAPVPVQPVVVNVSQTQTQTQTQAQPVPVEHAVATKPAPAPVQPVVQPALPQTGGGLTAGLFGTTAIFTTAWYYRRGRRGLAAALSRSGR